MERKRPCSNFRQSVVSGTPNTSDVLAVLLLIVNKFTSSVVDYYVISTPSAMELLSFLGVTYLWTHDKEFLSRSMFIASVDNNFR